MPQGKGTYGSQVGRPPKKGKKKYQEGGGIQGKTEAVLDAAMSGQELKSISLENIPTENAPDRAEMSPMGNEVGTGKYKEGGEVNILDVIKAVELPAEDYAKHGGSKSGAVKERAKQALAGTKKDVAKKAPEKKRKGKKKKTKESDWKEHTIFGPQFKKGVS